MSATEQLAIGGRKLPRRKTCERYGVSDRTIARWERNPKLNFPKPTVINGRKYDDEDKLSVWEREQATNKGQAA
jgi:hypothetical protein